MLKIIKKFNICINQYTYSLKFLDIYSILYKSGYIKINHIKLWKHYQAEDKELKKMKSKIIVMISNFWFKNN